MNFGTRAGLATVAGALCLVSPALAYAQPAHGPTAVEQPAVEEPEAETEPSKDVGPSKPKPPKKWEIAKPERRGGFAIGVELGAGVGTSNGYPNDAMKIGVAKYYTSTGPSFAGQSSLWIGGALADWLNFGAGAGFSQMISKGTHSPAPLMLFHTDVYPFYPLGGGFRDLGAMFEFGLGFPKTLANGTDAVLENSSLGSYMMGGFYWEGIHAWKLRMGPYVAIHYVFSDSVERPLGAIGFRMTLYSAP